MRVFGWFEELDPRAVGQNWNARLSRQKIFQLPELKVNPFRDRICDVFSSSSDGNLSFEDFLDMMSVFSERATHSVKAEYAFRIFDFGGNNFISRDDLVQIIDRLTGTRWTLTDEKMECVIDHIMNEADLDGDGVLSFMEFQHVLSKSPDFMSCFSIRL